MPAYIQNAFVIIALTSKSAFGLWPFTLDRGGCSELTNCQDCVVTYSYDDSAWIRRPCTWCPETSTCEMMNHYTGTCGTGDTIRDVCPTNADLPRCVYMTYSFYIAFSGRPDNHDECNAKFAYDWSSEQTIDK